MQKLTALKKRNIIYISILLFLLLSSFLYYIFFLRIKANDSISQITGLNTVFSNTNPGFNVYFGDPTNPDIQKVNFNVESTYSNPFHNSENETLWNKIRDIFSRKSRSDIEISLQSINFSETSNTSSNKYSDEIKTVADILGTSDIKTKTDLVESGYDSTDPESEQNISKPTIVNSNVANGIDLHYQIIKGKGIKEDIVIKSLDGFSDECKSDISKCSLPLNEYTFYMSLDEGVRIEKGWYTAEGRTSPIYYFVDEKGKYLAHFLPSYAEDSAGNKTYDVNLEVSQNNSGKYTIKVIVDSSWLLDSSRVYPVRIDPSIVHDTSSDFSTGDFVALKYLPSTEMQLTDTSVIGDWSFDETTNSTCSGGGDICDRSGNNYNATISGTVTSVTGVDSYARDFNGATGTHASLGDVAAFEVQSFTIEGWIRKEGTCGAFNYCTIFSKGGSGYKGYTFGLYGSSPVLDIRLDDQGTNGLQVIHGTTVLSDNTWYYVAVVVDGVNKSMKLYLNGNLEASGQYSDTISYGTEVVKIGNGNDNDDLPFYGSIDDLRFSNRAKAQSEIQNAYSKYTFGVYRSPLISTGGVQNFTFSYTGSGIKTSDGETPYSTAGLIAQWNFNETSGTTATSGGTCGTSCNGTLTNMVTTGQDASVNSGWTSNNRRLGTGAVMFDGSNDYVTGGNNSSMNITGSLSLGSWVKTSSSTYQEIISRDDGSSNRQYQLRINNDGTVQWILWFSSTGIDTNNITTKKINDGLWHFVAATYNSMTGQVLIYIDGKVEYSESQTAQTVSSVTVNTVIGALASSGYPMFGVIDSTSIYSRVLTSTEILSDYNSGSIEFQIRGGNTTTPDDGTWSNWTNTNETQVESFDNSYLYSTNSVGLIAYWPMDEASGTTVADVKYSYNATATGSTVTTGVYSYGRYFNGSSYYISTPSITPYNSSRTVEFWFKPMATGSQRGILSVGNGVAETAPLWLIVQTSGNLLSVYHGAAYRNGTTVLTAGTWYHAAYTYNASSNQVVLYLNGKVEYSGTAADSNFNNTNLYIGTGYGGYFSGNIDEVRIYNMALPASTIQADYVQGNNPNFASFIQQTSGGIKIEGTNSNRITNNQGQGLIDYWNLNESSGSTLTDSVGSNNLTASGTSITAGKYNLARSFNGSSDYASISSNLGITNGEITEEVWVKPTNATLSSDHPAIVSHYDDSAKVDYRIFQYTGGIGVARHAPNVAWNATSQVAVTAGQWYHVALTYSGTTLCFYLNGVIVYAASVSSTGSGSYTTQTVIGRGTATAQTYFAGAIDEVKIYNVAKTADQILEDYNATSTYYVNYNLSSTDLSSKTSVPFYIASDQPGSNISAILGESAFANYQTDANTVGLWHLDDISGKGAYIKDYSGKGNDGTASGTTYTSNGKISGARIFNGTSDIISVADNDSLSFTQNLTLDGWFKTSSSNTSQVILDKETGGSYYPEYSLYVNAGNVRGVINSANSGTNLTYVTSPLATYADGKWHYAAMTYDGSALKLYVDGILTAVTATNISLWNSTSPLGLGRDPGTNSAKFTGTLDELRISNVARTADQIRQAYEVGLRTLNINVNFGAKLNSSNLISNSSDTSFIVDATQLGFFNMGSNLYTGDKIIIKEITNSTEYIAQGTVSTVNQITGAVTVLNWDSGSTFPSGGFTTRAKVFKWEKEYIPIAGRTIGTQIDAISLLTLRITDVYDGRNIWIDDLRSDGGYINSTNTPIDLGQPYSYVQYRAIFLTADGNVSPYLNQVQVSYQDNGPSLDQLMRHGQWFDSSGQRKSFWWVNSN